MDEWDDECADDLRVPEWVRICFFFVQEGHDSSIVSRTYEILSAADIISCVVYMEGFRFSNAVEAVDEVKLTVLIRHKLVLITIIVVLIQA